MKTAIITGASSGIGEETAKALAENGFNVVLVARREELLTRLKDKLEAKGLIERYRSTRDRRIVHTRLKQAGQRILQDAPPPLGEDFVAAFMRLGERERRKTLQSFSLIADLVSGQQLEAL